MSSSLNTLIEGVSAIQRGDFSQGIELLQEFCKGYENNSDGKLSEYLSEYIYALDHIVKAYVYLGEKTKAIQLTKELTINEYPQVRRWAKGVLATLSPETFQSLPKEILENSNQPVWDSVSARMVLDSVNKYLEFGSDSSIVEALETACECIKFHTKEHLHAQVLLIEAYYGNGQFKNALALCNQLIYSEHYFIRLLVNKYLSFLSVNTNFESDTINLLISTQASVIYQEGYNALINKDYVEAVRLFESYCETSLPGTREYLQASQFLVDHYQKNGELEKASLLCLKLIKSQHKSSRRWARELLFTDLFNEVAPNDTVEKFKNIQSKLDLEKKSNSLLDIDKSEKSLVVTENQFQNSEEKFVSKSFILKTVDEFKGFSQQNLLVDLKVFENRRKLGLATIIILNITFFVIFLFLLQLIPMIFFKFIWSQNDIVFLSVADISCYWNIINIFLFSFIYFISIALLFIIYCLFYKFVFESFANQFEEKIVQKIYQFINKNQNLTISTVSSEIEVNQTLSDIGNSKLFNLLLQPNSIKQNHLMYGNINNIDIKFTTVDINSSININSYWRKIFDINYLMGDINTLVVIISVVKIIILFTFRFFLKGIPYVFTRIKNGKNIDFRRFQTEIFKNEIYNNKVFKGLFVTAKFNQIFQAVTIIQPKLLKTNINSLDYAQKKLIKLEYPKFNSFFTVYSSDEVQARHILSTSLIEKLVQFRQKTNKNIYLSFIDDTIYIAIEYPEGIFQPNLFKSILKFTPLREFFEAIQLILGVIENLKLNR